MDFLNKLFGKKQSTTPSRSVGTNLEECYRIIADSERQGMNMSTYKMLLQTAKESGDQEMIDAVLTRLKKTTFIR